MKKLILKKTCVVLQSSAVMKERNAALLLLLTSFIWGLSFVAQSVSSDLVGPFTFNSIRLLIGGIVLVPFAIPSIRKGMHDPGYWKKTLKAGIVCGLLLAAASLTQQIGVGYSGAGKGGFITSVYIIIVPFISLIFGKKVEKKTWIAGLVALIGMYLLCMGGENTISVGDIYLILCALLFSFHIMAIDALGKDVDGITMSMLQFFVGGIVTFPRQCFQRGCQFSMQAHSHVALPTPFRLSARNTYSRHMRFCCSRLKAYGRPLAVSYCFLKE